MSDNIFILGAGGHLRALNSIILSLNLNIKGIYDESFRLASEDLVCDYPVLGKYSDIKDSDCIILAIGNNKSRFELYGKHLSKIYTSNLIHPTSQIGIGVDIGDSNHFLANTFVNNYSVIGKNNIINTSAIIEHEALIGNHNHLSVGSIICGRVRIGDHCFLGAGSVVIDKISIGNNIIIGANTVVTKSINEAGTYVGNPVRRIK